ncbi:MAG TPA: hypothetical protein EYQ42_09825 [Thiotrichaceae bacterium]|nr:hypothetical protein [Thiotrichaceae bacterium]
MISSVNSETTDTAYNYCINKAVPDGSDLYYATIFETIKNKTINISLHALLNELNDVIAECSDPGVARMKLQWWQEEIERLFNNEARHPVTRQMQECLKLDAPLKSTFDSVIEFFNHFIFIKQTDSLETILSLFKSTTGEIWYQSAQQLSSEKTHPLKTVKEMGALIHFINCLQQPRTYINETRCIIPASYISNADLLNLQINTSNKLTIQKQVFSPLLIDLKARLDDSYKELKIEKNKHLQHVLIMNRLMSKTCDEILIDGCNLLGAHISLTPFRKLIIASWTHYFS